MFVKLTYGHSADDDPLWVRADSIVAMFRTWLLDEGTGEQRPFTRVSVGESDYWVHETPEEIAKMIRFSYQ